MHIIHRLLSQNPITAPLMRYGSYIKHYKLTLQLEDRIIKKMIPGWKKMKILDVGSGPGFREKDRRFKNVDFVCFDIYAPSLAACRDLGLKTKLGDARFISRYFKPKSFDIIWAIDVIEHMTKKEGVSFLKQLEQVARQQIIISTPLGWFPQDHECVEDGDNVHQDHKSAWYPNDFEKRGYDCEVVYDLHGDIRKGAKSLIKKKKAVKASQMFLVKTFV